MLSCGESYEYVRMCVYMYVCELQEDVELWSVVRVCENVCLCVCELTRMVMKMLSCGVSYLYVRRRVYVCACVI